MSTKKWYHVTTRLMGLLEIQLANEVYPRFPVTASGFNLDTVVIGRDGILERYVDEAQLKRFEKLVRNNSYLKLLQGFKDYEEQAIPLIKKLKKDPLENRQEFMLIFRQLWIHEISSFFIGLYCQDKKSLALISSLRGTKSAQHLATSEFLPKLLTAISSRLKIEVELLKYALPEEIISLKLSAKVLALRRKLYVLELIKGRLRVLAGAQAKSFVKDFTKVIKPVSLDDSSELKGTPAYLGQAVGRVVLVIHDKDLKRVKAGDILVSPMTRTSFIAAMKKAAAFITDEGGITCHAAIVARELKKPCVVGTKFATKVLKDGMKVMVDAKKGIIKILS